MIESFLIGEPAKTQQRKERIHFLSLILLSYMIFAFPQDTA